MNVMQMQEIMTTYGLVIRTVPNQVTSILDERHKNKFPDGKIKYLEQYGREMLIVKTIPEHAGKFLIESVNDTGRIVRFSPGKYFDSVEDAINDFMKSELRKHRDLIRLS